MQIEAEYHVSHWIEQTGKLDVFVPGSSCSLYSACLDADWDSGLVANQETRGELSCDAHGDLMVLQLHEEGATNTIAASLPESRFRQDRAISRQSDTTMQIACAVNS